MYVFVVLLLCSCRTTKYVPVETVRTEYKEADTKEIYERIFRMFESMRENESRSDSLIDREKETLVLKENGDTASRELVRIIYRSSIREKELEKTVERKDSLIYELNKQLLSVKSDTVQVPYPVEKQLTKWQRIKIRFGEIGFGLLIVLIILFVVRIKRKL